MAREARLGVNQDTQESNPLPDDVAFLLAVRDVCALPQQRYGRGASANDVAWKLGVRPMRRNGRGAVKGSWSGSMSPALRVAPRLRSLARRELLFEGWDEDGRRHIYTLSGAGERMLWKRESTPICAFCRRFTPGTRGCEAFPDGIPDPIWTNEADHRQPIAGDRGLRFAPHGHNASVYANELLGKG